MTKQNKNSRKVTGVTLSAALAASALVPAAVAADPVFTDVPEDIWYGDAVNYLAEQKILQGPGDDTFNPNGIIDRAQAAEVIYKALKLDSAESADFTDLEKDWYKEAINAVVEAEIFEGTGDNLFSPNMNLSRAQAAKVIVDAYDFEEEADISGFPDADDIPVWATEDKNYLAIAVENGVMEGQEADNGDLLLAPNADISRAEFATMVKRAIDSVVEELGIEDVNAVTEDGVTTVTAQVSGAEEDAEATVEVFALSDDEAEGEDTDGEEAEGEDTDGEEAEGEDTDGEEAEGEDTDGEEAEGEDTDGEEAEGEDTDGEEAEDEDTDGEEAEDEDTDGEEAEGEDTDGEDTEDEDANESVASEVVTIDEEGNVEATFADLEAGTYKAVVTVDGVSESVEFTVEEVAEGLTVESATAIDSTTLSVVLSDETEHEVTLEEALEEGVEAEVTVVIDENEYTVTVTWENDEESEESDD